MKYIAFYLKYKSSCGSNRASLLIHYHVVQLIQKFNQCAFSLKRFFNWIVYKLVHKLNLRSFTVFHNKFFSAGFFLI